MTRSRTRQCCPVESIRFKLVNFRLNFLPFSGLISGSFQSPFNALVYSQNLALVLMFNLSMHHNLKFRLDLRVARPKLTNFNFLCGFGAQTSFVSRLESPHCVAAGWHLIALKSDLKLFLNARRHRKLTFEAEVIPRAVCGGLKLLSNGASAAALNTIDWKLNFSFPSFDLEFELKPRCRHCVKSSNFVLWTVAVLFFSLKVEEVNSHRTSVNVVFSSSLDINPMPLCSVFTGHLRVAWSRSASTALQHGSSTANCAAAPVYLMLTSNSSCLVRSNEFTSSITFESDPNPTIRFGVAACPTVLQHNRSSADTPAGTLFFKYNVLMYNFELGSIR
ncbi:hypothetical protein R3P38DRAFT_2808533 [Favolaschia claudopus]|uniref:Uncharacterized protein n=1 Tax=Favolaschia claudopus TaxID=2862362 RepID=A0AAV9ZFF5_9AGAR